MADFDVKPSVVDRVRDRPRHLQRLAAFVVIVGMGLALLYPLWRERQTPPANAHETQRLPPEDRAVMPLEPMATGDLRRIALGRRLFFEPKLSPLNRSCATCHAPEHHGTLNTARSPGLQDRLDEFNVPTVLNVGLNPYLGWRGRLTSLADQLDQVINNPRHMGSNWAWVVGTLSGDADYRRRFFALYPDGINRASVTDAIIAFERSLVALGSPFDRYLQGEVGALTADQLAGYRRFQEYGCIACHQGRNLGGNLIARFGIFGNPFRDGVFGRSTAETRAAPKLRVPPLRNVAETAPYLHDGSVASLEEVVRLMGRYQLGRDIPDQDVRLIVAFLRSLSAPLPKVFAR